MAKCCALLPERVGEAHKLKEMGNGRRKPAGLARMRSWLPWLCASILPPLLAASRPRHFHRLRLDLDTTHKRAGGFVPGFLHQ